MPAPPHTLEALDRAIAALAELRATLTGDRPPDEIQTKVEALRVACRERGILLTADEHVREADAAALLGRSPFTLRNARHGARPLAYRKRFGRVEYALSELARYLVTQDAARAA